MTSQQQQHSVGPGTIDNAQPRHEDAILVDAARVQPAPAGGIFTGLNHPEETPGRKGDKNFGSDEHQMYGNEGARKAGYTGTYAPGAGAYPFELTQGDISLLAGDEFDARETPAKTADPRQKKEKKAGVFDSFWTIARTVSKNPGRQPGTQDEIIYALHKDVKGDSRFKPGGVWAHLIPIFEEPNNPVAKAVENRYLWSASVNFEHFAHPGGKSGPKESDDRGSAGGSYHHLHETAIKRAYDAQQNAQPVNDAMAHDAAAQHFLQDSFSSGHVRTPRREIAEYWDGKYPLLNDQFKKSIAQEMAVYINAHETNVPTIAGSVRDIYAEIIAEVDAKAGALPPLTMDPLVGLVAHDVDNTNGVFVKNDWAAWQSFGDGHGGVRNAQDQPGEPAPAPREGDTRHYVEQAVSLSVEDINHAFTAPPGLTDAALLAHVKSKTPSPAVVKDMYGAEQAMPRVDASKEKSNQTWKASSLRDLWATSVRSDGAGGTYGQIIEKSFRALDGEFNKGLMTFHCQIDATKAVIEKGIKVGTVHPQRAFDHGFMDPLIAHPLPRLERIINFNPAGGQNYVREDGATMEDLNRLDHLGVDKASEQSGKTEKPNVGNSAMRWLTTEQRAQYVKNLVGGYQGDDEILRIYELFVTAGSGAERRAVFKLVEGHDWSGDLKRKDSTFWMLFLHNKNRAPFIALMNL